MEDEYSVNMTIIIAKLNTGDAISDEELEQAIEFYTQMEKGLRLLGPQYHIAWCPVAARLRELHSYHDNRASKMGVIR